MYFIILLDSSILMRELEQLEEESCGITQDIYQQINAI